jgi:chromate reductase, NAD(P)H dehydrogenase (quinone)
MNVLGISGSLRGGSHNSRLLRAAAEVLPPGARLEVWDNLRDLPPFDEDLEHEPIAPVQDLRDAVAYADALLISTPEYNAGIPGQLKNAIDWLSRPYPDNVLKGKPVAVIGASTGVFGAIWAQDHVRKSVAFAGAKVLEGELPVGQAHETLDEQGRLTDPEQREKLTQLLSELVQAAEQRVVSS